MEKGAETWTNVAVAVQKASVLDEEQAGCGSGKDETASPIIGMDSKIGRPLSWRPRSIGRSRRLPPIRTPESRKRRTDSPRTDGSPHIRSIGFVGIDTSSDGLWGSRSDDTRASGSPYYCEICLENRPAEAGFVLSACGHTFCRDCLKAFVKSKITDGQVYPMCFRGVEAEGEVDKMEQGAQGCHGSSRTTAWPPSYLQESKGGESKEGSSLAGSSLVGLSLVSSSGEGRRRKSCGVAITKGDIESLLGHDSVTRRKYARFLFSRENRNVRECPRCSYLQVGEPKVLEMRCNSCRTAFCFEHGGAHIGRTCTEYSASVAEENSRTMELIERLTKPCPGCGTPVEKLGGCNQMVCYHCDSSFCWICGAEVDRGTFPVHFQWWNINGCPNQQLQEDSHTGPGGRQFHRVLSAIQIIVIGPVALALTIASSVACVCCLPALNMSPRELFTGCISAWGNFVMLLPILPFICAGLLVMGIVYVLFLPFQLVSALHHKYRLRQRRLEAGNAVDSTVLDSNRGIQSVGPIRQSLQGVPFSELSDSSRAWGLSEETNSTAAAASNVATLGGREGEPSGSGGVGARPPTNPARPRGFSDDTSSATAAASNVATLGGREYEPSGSGDVDARQATNSARPRGFSDDTSSATAAASNVATLGGREYEPSSSGDVDARQATNSARPRGFSDDTSSATAAASNVATLGGRECDPSSSVDIAARPPVNSLHRQTMSSLAALLGLEGGNLQEQNGHSRPGVTTTSSASAALGGLGGLGIGIGIGISSSGSGSTLGTASGTGGGVGRPRVTFPPLIPGPTVPPPVPHQRNGSRVITRARLATSASLPISMGESAGDARYSLESATGGSGRNSAVTFREFMDMWLGASPLASVTAGAAPPPASASASASATATATATSTATSTASAPAYALASASASAPTPTPTPTSTPAQNQNQNRNQPPALTSTPIPIPSFASAPAVVSTEGHGGKIDVGGEDGEGNVRLSRLDLQGAARVEVSPSLKCEGKPTEASVPPVAYAE